MSYADIRFQRIEENINELKDSIKFLSNIMHDHLLDKDNEKNKNDTNDTNDKNDKNENEKNNKNGSDKNEKNGSRLMSLMEWVKSPSTIVYSTSFIIGAFTSYGLYHFYDKK